MVPNTKLKDVAQALQEIKDKLDSIGKESLKSIELIKHSSGREKEVLDHNIHINYLAHESYEELTHQLSNLRFVKSNVVQDKDNYLLDEDPTQWG